MPGEVDAAELARRISEYLAGHPAASVLEDGQVKFDMRLARYSVSESHGRCLLQFWSEELNLVRTVVGVEERAKCLRIVTRRMGALRPQSLEIVPSSDRRTPTTRDTARRNYLRLLERVLTRNFLGAKADGFRSAMDLEHSFGPAYARGRLLRGAAAEAVIGVGESESAATIDGVLTLGLLWLDHCRNHADARRHFGGLNVVVPPGTWRTTAERMAWLNASAANFQVFTLDERSEQLEPVEVRDTGNLESRLAHAFSATLAVERCAAGVARLMELVPEASRERVEVRAKSTSEVALLLHGLEFARVRRGTAAHSFAGEDEVSFGAGANETLLTDQNADACHELFMRLFAARRPDGEHNDPLFRMHPERWLESRLRNDIAEILPGLRDDLMYSQVPALSSGDRGMLDLLALDREGRLTVLELKADEDLHLPLQALDYWIRVRALNADRQPVSGGGRPVSAFERQGYFAGAEVSSREPRLLLAAPALRIHPANEPVLRFFSPQVEWELIAVSEHWRRDLSVVFRKRSGDAKS